MIYSFDGYIPVVHESSFVHPQATVIGNVIIGKDVYVGPSAVVRADWGGIHLKDGSNVQENCTVHMFPGITIALEEGAHIGHGAVIHGAHIGKNTLIGMNAVIMDEAEIGDECIVGALSFVKGKSIIPNRSLVVGNPYRIIKQVSDEMLMWKTKGTELYQMLPSKMKATMLECEPLRTIPTDRKKQEKIFETWKK